MAFLLVSFSLFVRILHPRETLHLLIIFSGPVDEIIVEVSSTCERERRLSGESVRASKTSAKKVQIKTAFKYSRSCLLRFEYIRNRFFQ